MLVSLAAMKTYLGEITADYDAFLTQQIQMISDTIENYCGRKFESNSYTQKLYFSDFNQVRDKQRLFLFHYPVISITSLKEIEVFSTGNIEEVLVADTDYRLNKEWGSLKKFYSGVPELWFSDLIHDSYIEAIYTAGYATIPTPIQEVVYNLVEERYNKKKNGTAISFGNDVQRLSIPGAISIDFDYSLQANERNAKYGMILGNWRNVLDPYRSDRAVIGSVRESYID